MDGFLREFVSSVNAEEDLEVCKYQLKKPYLTNYLQEVTEETLVELKACFLEAYDDNKDGKIDIREVCQIIVQGVPSKTSL